MLQLNLQHLRAHIPNLTILPVLEDLRNRRVIQDMELLCHNKRNLARLHLIRRLHLCATGYDLKHAKTFM